MTSSVSSLPVDREPLDRPPHARSHHQPAPVRRLDARFLVKSLVLLLVLALGGFGLYHLQTRRLVERLVQQAARQIEAGNSSAAVTTLNHVFSLRPNEPRAVVMMAELHAPRPGQTTALATAVAWHYRALGMAPERDDLRQQLAQMLVEGSQFTAARRETETLLQRDPESLVAAKWDVLARLGQFHVQREGTSADIRRRLTEHLERDPRDLRVARTLAYFLREDLGGATGTELGREADEVMNRAVASDLNRAAAYLVRYQYRDHFGLEGADFDIARALELAPRVPDVVLTAARDRARRGDDVMAERLYRELIAISPSDATGYVGLGDAQYRQRRIDEAVATWELGVRRSYARDAELNLRLAEGYTELHRFDEAAQKLVLLDSLVSEAALSEDAQRRWWLQTSTDVLRGKWHLRQGDYRQAVPLLRHAHRSTERLQLQRDGVGELAINSLILLGEAYAMHDHRVMAAETLEEAFRRDRSRLQLGLMVAEAWAAAGRDDRAKSLARELLGRPSPPPAALLLLAQLELNEQLVRVPIERDWRDVDATMAQAEQVLPDSWRVQLLKAKLGMAKRGVDSLGSALQLLLSLEREHGDNPDLWRNLVLTYEQLGRREGADRALARFEQLDPSSVMPRLVRAQLLIRRGEYDAAARILDAAQRAVEPGPEQNERLHQIDQLRWMMIARRGDSGQLREWLIHLREKYPADVRPVVALADAALTAGKFDECQRWESVLTELEDEDQAYTRYFQARRMLAQKQYTTELRDLLDRLNRTRPAWAYVSELQAELLEAEGRTDEAIAAYKRSIQQGNDHFRVHSDLIRLLYEANRFAEAEVYFDLLQGEARPQHELSRHNVSVSHRPAPSWSPQQVVSNEPRSALARVWLGQSLALGGQLEQARSELEQAVQLQPGLAMAWIALASFSARVDGSQQTLEILDRLSTEASLSDEQREFALGFGYELIGQRQAAIEHYEVALERNPEQPEYLVRVASCLLGRDLDRAREYLRRAVQLDPRHANARRLLASVLSRSGADAAEREARDLLVLGSDDLTNWRLQGALMAEKNQLAEAVELFQQIVRRSTAQPRDWLMLAQLHQEMGRDDLAYETFVDLSRNASAGPRDLSRAIDFFLQHGRAEDAQRTWTQLEPNIADPWTKLTYQVRLAYLAGDREEADNQVAQFVANAVRTPAGSESTGSLAERSGTDEVVEPDEGAKDEMDAAAASPIAQWYLRAGQLYESMGELDGAERWYRRLAEEWPEYQAPLALHLAQHAELDEALAITLESLRERLTVQGAVLLVRILLHGRPEPVAYPEAEKLLKEALAQFPEHAELTFAVSNLRLKQQRLDAGLELLRRTVELDPDHLLGWNNMAALLAERPQGGDEALACIDRAMEAAGYELPTLLDTKGVVLMRRGEVAEALPLLESAARQAGTADPRYYFHLAQAQSRLGDDDAAAKAMELAERHGLLTRYLTPVELEEYRELASRRSADAATTPTVSPPNRPNSS